MNSKYGWPASRITVREMAMLYEARLKLKKPITELLRLAVEDSYNAKTKGEVKHVS
jgi:hypothetical protein